MSSLRLAGVGSDVPVRRSIDWRVPISMAVFALVGFVAFGVLGRDVPVTFSWASRGVATFIPDWVANSQVVGLATGVLMLVITAAAARLAVQRRKVPGWFIAVFALAFLIALLGWVGAGDRVPFVYLLTGAIAFSVPVVLGALAGVLGERVGVVNIAIEGQLLMGAFMAAFVGSLTSNLLLGLSAAVFSGAVVGMVLAVFAVRYAVEQIIIGVVVNVLVAGITSFIYTSLMTRDEARYNFPGTLPFIKIPFLSEIPVFGPVLFNQRITTYLMFILIPLVAIALSKTRWGLRLRAVGEHPLAADTVGINVPRTRFWVVSGAGLLAGLGGAAMSIGSVGSFVRDMSAGQGYIALACVILGRWNPWAATAAALLFGFSKQFGVWAGQSGSGIPSDLIAMIPYVVTLIAVGGFVGRSVAPAAVGKAYTKTEG
jgi:ABC-type uncharacterized transport system permease subunit